MVILWFQRFPSALVLLDMLELALIRSELFNKADHQKPAEQVFVGVSIIVVLGSIPNGAGTMV